jgi:hypothetical protein
MSDLTSLRDHIHEAADTLTPADPAALRARGERRRARHRVATASMVATSLLVLTAFAAAFVPAVLSARPDAAPQDVAGTRTVVLRQGTITGNLDGSPALGAGSMWVPLRVSSGSMDLVRYDAVTVTEKARWQILRNPRSITVSDHYVWVAGNNASGVNPDASPDGYQVQQFDLAGKLIHTYSVTFMNDLVAGAGDSVWLVQGTTVPGGSHAYLAHLHDGIVDPSLTLAGTMDLADSDHELAVCPDAIYAVTDRAQAGVIGGMNAILNRVVPGDPAATSSVPIVGGALWCEPGGGVLAIEPVPTDWANLTNGGWPALVARRFFGGAPSTGGAAIALPPDQELLGFCDSGMWLGYIAASYSSISFYDPTVQRHSAPVDLTSTVWAGGMDGCALWTEEPDVAHPDRTIVRELGIQ